MHPKPSTTKPRPKGHVISGTASTNTFLMSFVPRLLQPLDSLEYENTRPRGSEVRSEVWAAFTGRLLSSITCAARGCPRLHKPMLRIAMYRHLFPAGSSGQACCTGGFLGVQAAILGKRLNYPA